MDYISIDFTLNPAEPYRELLLGELSLFEFESFEDTEDGLRAYIPKPLFKDSIFSEIDLLDNVSVEISYKVQTIPEQNWNAVWEADFAPIEVDETCRVRAPFHSSTGAKYEVVIQPQMSFGTGHHETTWAMMRAILNLKINDLDVLDMGAGTGVLAILAEKKGARSVVAIDVDDWAFENAVENVALNSAVHITVEKGDGAKIGGRRFHIILANINKNVLLYDMSLYADSLHSDGVLLLSGFFESDVPDLKRKAEQCGLSLVEQIAKNNWAVMKLKKNK